MTRHLLLFIFDGLSIRPTAKILNIKEKYFLYIITQYYTIFPVICQIIFFIGLCIKKGSGGRSLLWFLKFYRSSMNSSTDSRVCLII